MTAEVAIMNKLGMALAADSAATISSENPSLNDHKIYNSANKLFTLSKYHPVGVMIFNASDFMGVPWELLIKMYRQHLGKTKFDTLREYADNLFTFLQNNWPDHTSDEFYVKTTVSELSVEICKETDKRIEGLFDQQGSVSSDDIEAKLSEVVFESLKSQEEKLDLSQCTEEEIEEVAAQVKSLFGEIVTPILGNRKLAVDALDAFLKLNSLVILLHPGFRKTGLVVAGFGERQIYPSMLEFELIKRFSGKIDSKEISGTEVSLGSPGVIVPFAQSGEVRSFLEGVGGGIKDFFHNEVQDVFLSTFPSMLKSELTKLFELDQNMSDKLDRVVNEMGEGAYKAINQELAIISSQSYVRPVVEMVAHLPINELATMAETFINLESFRKKVTMNTESVGGPIDVAIITKGDGFVWIKRKHYFKPDLNHQFFNNYFMEDIK